MDDALLLKFLLGRATDEEAAQITAWLEVDRSNRETLDRLEILWTETGKLDPAPVAVDVDKAWDRISARIDEAENSTEDESARVVPLNRPSIVRFRIAFLRVAAVAAVLAGIAFLMLLLNRPVPLEKLMAVNGNLTDTLPDGSVVTLRHGSVIEFPSRFSKDARRVKLSGEAFFKVRHDPAHPFVVQQDQAQVRVLGTEFLVSGSGNGNPGDPAVGLTSVFVQSGKVMFFTVDTISGDTTLLILGAGQKGLLRNGTKKPVTDSVTGPDELFWKDRTLFFRNTPVREVAIMLKRCYDLDIRVSDTAILDCRLTASFRDEKPEVILQVIAGTFDLELTGLGNSWILKGKGCGKER